MGLRSQKGEGIVAALLVAVIVAIIAVGLGYFFQNQNKVSKTVQLSGSCESIAASFQSYILSTNNESWINSVGPNTSAATAAEQLKFPSVSSQNVDGLNRYFNIQENIVAYSQPLTLSSARTNVPANFKSISYLNRNNSYTRLVTLARLKDVCINNFTNVTEGTVVYSNVTANAEKLAGIPLNEPNTEIRLKIDFLGQNLCDGSKRLGSLPKGDAIVRYKIDVTTAVGSPSAKKCSTEGTLSANVDVDQPLVLSSFSNVTQCPATPAVGSQCFHGLSGQLTAAPNLPIQVEVRAVRLENACRNCLLNLPQFECSAAGNSVRNAIAACGSSCNSAEPGSIFFCRLATAQTFLAAPSLEDVPWWPCHAQPNTVPGNVTITYPAVNASQAQNDTRATITITNLPSGRNIYFDVRALDSYGQTFGPSLSESMPNLLTNMNIPECSCNRSCAWQTSNCTLPGTCTFDCCNQANATALNNCSRVVQQPDTVNCLVQCRDPQTGAIIGPEFCNPATQPTNPQTVTITCSSNVNNAATCGGLPPVPSCGLPVVTPWSACTAVACGDGGTREQTLTCKNPDGTPHAPASDCANSCVETETCFAASCPACVFPSNPEDGWGTCDGATCASPGLQTRSGNCENPDGTPGTGCGVCEETRECFATGCATNCDFTGINYGTCTGDCGETGTQTRTGNCVDENGNPTTGCPDNCNQQQDCQVTCTSSCDYTSATWGNCEPGCPTEPGIRSQTGVCKYSDNTLSNECAGGCTQSEPCNNSCAQPACEWTDWGSCSAQDCNASPPVASQRTRTQQCMLNGQPDNGCSGGCPTVETEQCAPLSCPSCNFLSEQIGGPYSGSYTQNPQSGHCGCDTYTDPLTPCTIVNQGRNCPGLIVIEEDGYCGGSASGDCHSCVCSYSEYCNSINE